MLDFGNRLIRYLIPPIFVLISCYFGFVFELFGDFKVPKLSDVSPLLGISIFLITTGFVINSTTTVIFSRVYRKLYGSDFEAIIDSELMKSKVDEKLQISERIEEKISDAKFYPFLVYHHSIFSEDHPKLYSWSVRNFNHTIVILNSLIGLFPIIIGVTIYSIVNSCYMCSSFLWWLTLNLLVITFLLLHYKHLRSRRRRLFHFLLNEKLK